MFAASFIAVFQTNLQAHAGLFQPRRNWVYAAGDRLLIETGVTGTLVHLFNHGITKAALFMGAGVFILRCGSTFFDDINRPRQDHAMDQCGRSARRA